MTDRGGAATAHAAPRAPTILVIDDDVVVADLVRAVLTDEGYAVSVLNVLDPDAIRVAVNQLEPDCVLLDSSAPSGPNTSWDTAAWAHARGRPVPVILFTADLTQTQEVQAGASDRARAARFAAVLAKPFDIDALVDTVARCAGRAVPFERGVAADAARSAALQRKLVAAGALDVETSTRREWATFATAAGALMLIYFWQRDGVYYVVELAGGGPRLVGRFHDLDAAVALATTAAS